MAEWPNIPAGLATDGDEVGIYPYAEDDCASKEAGYVSLCRTLYECALLGFLSLPSVWGDIEEIGGREDVEAETARLAEEGEF